MPQTNSPFHPNVEDIGSHDSLTLMDLIEQEDVRARQLTGKRLICEMPFGQDDVEQLRRFLLPKGIQAWSHPTLAAMMTVGIGIYHYNRGNFWSEFPGLDSSGDQSRWGQKFVAFLNDRNSLETFRSVKEEGGHPYLGPILAHGGIPQTCLPDFFSLITRYGDREQSGQDLIETIKSKTLHVDRPVQRFIKYGGEVAEDFVSRFLALWQCYERGDMSAKCNLPGRVVEEFSTWWPNHKPKRRNDSKRMPKPELRIEPSGQGVFLYLPRCDGYPDIAVNALWRTLGKEWAVTRAHEIPLTEPRSTWEVSCVGRVYTLEGPADEIPVLFFEPDTGKAISEPSLRRLPTKVWALFKGKMQTDPFPDFDEEFTYWQGYYFAIFNLSDKHQLRVGNSTFDVRRPYFHCDTDPIVHGVFSQNDVPVACDLPEIKWDGKANLSLTINDKPQGNIDIAPDELTILLDKPGDYLIDLRGPLGESIRKHFVLIPGLTVEADPPVMWPNKKSVKWHLSTSAGHIQAGNALPPFIRYGSDLEFKVVYPGYEIDLHAEVPQLLWRLLPQQNDHDWSREPMSIWLDDLCQNNYPLLECAFGKLEQDVEVTLVARHSTSQLEAKQQRSGTQASWFFDLRGVRDLLEQTGKSEEFDLLIRTKNGSELFRGKSLSARPRWDLRNFSVKWKKKEGRHVIEVSWQENGKSITGKWLVIIPLWEPAKGAVLQYEVNDRCSYKWDIPLSELRPGRYLVKAVHAPWGCDDWIEAQAVIEQLIDVYPEAWPETFGRQHDAETVDFYLQSLLAHWYRPERVQSPPMAPSGLAMDEIIRFLEGLSLADKLEHIKIPEDRSGSLNIFCANAMATTEAYRAMRDKKMVAIWEHVLPSTEIITLELNKWDKDFVREVAFQYTSLNTAAKRIRQQHGQRVLSGALAKWHKNLSKEFPPIDEVIFLCEKFGIFEGQGPARVREYEQLKSKYQSREAV